MKKSFLILVLVGSIQLTAQTAANKPLQKETSENVDKSIINLSYYLVGCQLLMKTSLNYNDQPLIFTAFLESVGHYAEMSDKIVSYPNNRQALIDKLAPIKIEDLEQLIKLYADNHSSVAPLSFEQMASFNLWIAAVEKHNKRIVLKLLK